MASSINIVDMKTFKQYLSEIFNPNKTYKLSHPELVETGEDHVIKYKHTPKDEKSNLINDDEIVTSFAHNGNNSWDVVFTRGGYVSRPIKRPTNNVLNPAIKVFDHLNHFVQTQKTKTGVTPLFTYSTPSPTKHRIYQKMFDRLGVKAWNTFDEDEEDD